MNLRALWALALKDLKLFFHDRRAVVVTLVTPIAIASFFGFLFNGGGSSKISVRVSDLDGSAVSRAVVSGLSSDKALEVVSCSVGEARDKVLHGKAAVAVILPKGFGDTATRAFFNAADKAEIQMLHDPSHSAELAMVRGILTEHVMEAVSREAFTGESGRKAAREALQDLQKTSELKTEDKLALTDLLTSVEKWQDRQGETKASGGGELPAGGIAMPFTVKEEAVTSGDNVAYNGYSHSYAGMAIQFILFAAVDLGVGILLERQLGIWKRLRIAPLSRATLLMAKATSGALISLLALSTTFAFGMVVFGIRVHGSLAGFVLLCVASAIMASAFGLMLAALGSTPGATRGIAIFAVLVMVMLGGGWVPAFIFPAWLQKVTLVIPTRWAVDGLDAMTWRGLGLSSALPAVGVLLLFTLIFGAVAVGRFRWEES